MRSSTRFIYIQSSGAIDQIIIIVDSYCREGKLIHYPKWKITFHQCHGLLETVDVR
jgi:hypothetical protein